MKRIKGIRVRPGVVFSGSWIVEEKHPWGWEAIGMFSSRGEAEAYATSQRPSPQEEGTR